MPEDIPVQNVARQVPPPRGRIRQFLYNLGGPSYRTTIAAYFASLPALAVYITQCCPHLMDFTWDRKEAIGLFWAVTAAGGLIKFGHSAKDVSATGVQK